jgi:hypothetical protein
MWNIYTEEALAHWGLLRHWAKKITHACVGIVMPTLAGDVHNLHQHSAVTVSRTNCHCVTHKCTPLSFENIPVSDVTRCRSNSFPLHRNCFLIRFYVPNAINLSTVASSSTWIFNGLRASRDSKCPLLLPPAKGLYYNISGYHSGDLKRHVCWNAMLYRLVATVHGNLHKYSE